jgi:hypothetical protein
MSFKDLLVFFAMTPEGEKNDSEPWINLVGL